MRKVFIAATVLALAVTAVTVEGQGPKPDQPRKPDPRKVKELMRRKLDNSQRVLEALATNDLGKAAKHAEELMRIRKEVSWKVLNTRAYETWSDEFTRSAEGIVKAAKEKNLEAAKLSYLGMTLSCFHCHSYVRDQGDVSAFNLECSE